MFCRSAPPARLALAALCTRPVWPGSPALAHPPWSAQPRPARPRRRALPHGHPRPLRLRRLQPQDCPRHLHHPPHHHPVHRLRHHRNPHPNCSVTPPRNNGHPPNKRKRLRTPPRSLPHRSSRPLLSPPPPLHPPTPIPLSSSVSPLRVAPSALPFCLALCPAFLPCLSILPSRHAFLLSLSPLLFCLAFLFCFSVLPFCFALLPRPSDSPFCLPFLPGPSAFASFAPHFCLAFPRLPRRPYSPYISAHCRSRL